MTSHLSARLAWHDRGWDGRGTVSSYRESWERKKAWYEGNAFTVQLVTSEDEPVGRIDATEIERTARRRTPGE